LRTDSVFLVTQEIKRTFIADLFQMHRPLRRKPDKYEATGHGTRPVRSLEGPKTRRGAITKPVTHIFRRARRLHRALLAMRRAVQRRRTCSPLVRQDPPSAWAAQ